MNFVEFLSGVGPDYKERMLSEIWRYTDFEIDNTHDFIQVVFPTDKLSKSSFHGLYLKSQEEIEAIQKCQIATTNLAVSSSWFVEYLERNGGWQNKYDHNHLRISRIIQCLRLLVSNIEAERFREKVFAPISAESKITNKTLKIWQSY